MAAAVAVCADAIAEPDHLSDEVIPRKIGEVVVHGSLPIWFGSPDNDSQMRPKSFILPNSLTDTPSLLLRGSRIDPKGTSNFRPGEFWTGSRLFRESGNPVETAIRVSSEMCQYRTYRSIPNW
jgi:hypothetical protein